MIICGYFNIDLKITYEDIFFETFHDLGCSPI